jgi:hypothetical protein
MLYNLGTLAMLTGGTFLVWVLILISIDHYFGE